MYTSLEGMTLCPMVRISTRWALWWSCTHPTHGKHFGRHSEDLRMWQSKICADSRFKKHYIFILNFYLFKHISLVDAQVFLILQKLLCFAKRIISVLFIFLFYKHCSLLIIFFFSSLLIFNFLLGFVWHKLDKNWIHENSCHK